MTAGAFSRNISKLFSELKLVADKLLFIYEKANWEATENTNDCDTDIIENEDHKRL